MVTVKRSQTHASGSCSKQQDSRGIGPAERMHVCVFVCVCVCVPCVCIWCVCVEEVYIPEMPEKVGLFINSTLASSARHGPHWTDQRKTPVLSFPRNDPPRWSSETQESGGRPGGPPRQTETIN